MAVLLALAACTGAPPAADTLFTTLPDGSTTLVSKAVVTEGMRARLADLTSMGAAAAEPPPPRGRRGAAEGPEECGKAGTHGVEGDGAAGVRCRPARGHVVPEVADGFFRLHEVENLDHGITRIRRWRCRAGPPRGIHTPDETAPEPHRAPSRRG